MEKIQKQLQELDRLLYEVKIQLLIIQIDNLIKTLGDMKWK